MYGHWNADPAQLRTDVYYLSVAEVRTVSMNYDRHRHGAGNAQLNRRVRISRVTCCLSAFLSLATLECSPKPPEAEARSRLAALLSDSLGRTSDLKVSFLVDGGSRDTHLYVNFDTLAFSNQSDSSFQLYARDIARLSIRHYEKANHLDSITVSARKEVKPGLSRIYHTRTFSIAQLGGGFSR